MTLYKTINTNTYRSRSVNMGRCKFGTLEVQDHIYSIYSTYAAQEASLCKAEANDASEGVAGSLSAAPVAAPSLDKGISSDAQPLFPEDSLGDSAPFPETQVDEAVHEDMSPAALPQCVPSPNQELEQIYNLLEETQDLPYDQPVPASTDLPAGNDEAQIASVQGPSPTPPVNTSSEPSTSPGGSSKMIETPPKALKMPSMPPPPLSPAAADARLRRVMAPRMDGTFLVSNDFVEMYRDKTGGGRDKVLSLFERSGYNPDGAPKL